MVPEGAKAPSFLFSHIYICRHCEERSDEATQGPTRRPSTREPLGCFAFGSQRRKMRCRRRALVFGRLAGPDRTFPHRPRALSVCPPLPSGHTSGPPGEAPSSVVQRGRTFLTITR